LALGDKNLLRAAWANAAPHHAFARSLKVGKEEIMGMLAAVEMWTRRDHAAEWKEWESRLNYIAARVSAAAGVSVRTVLPEGLSNHTPTLRISWESARLGITGERLAKHLLHTEPRIVLAETGGGGSPETSVGVVPYMMMPGEEKTVAERLYAVLSNPPRMEEPPPPSGEPADVAGLWSLEIRHLRGSSRNRLLIEQKGNALAGRHEGLYYSGDLRGDVRANQVRFQTHRRAEGTHLGYTFQGKVEGGAMSGSVDMGEYGEAAFTATRQPYA
jgi:L-seryl-tRNA(Ser) seleniumtransferase